MPEWLQHTDEWISRLLHVQLGSPFADQWVPWLRNPYFWSPVYLFALVWMLSRRRWWGFWWCIFFLTCFLLADFLSASVLKPFFQRPRPCHTDLSFALRQLVACGSGFSLPSAHASNHAAMSVFIIRTLQKDYPFIQLPAILWALLVGYAQIYVGVHYFTDILAGFILGGFIGWLLGSYLLIRNGRWISSQDI